MLSFDKSLFYIVCSFCFMKQCIFSENFRIHETLVNIFLSGGVVVVTVCLQKIANVTWIFGLWTTPTPFVCGMASAANDTPKGSSSCLQGRSIEGSCNWTMTWEHIRQASRSSWGQVFSALYASQLLSPCYRELLGIPLAAYCVHSKQKQENDFHRNHVSFKTETGEWIL